MQPHAVFFIFSLCILSGISVARAEPSATPSLYGMMGLNTVPGARMEESGNVRASLSAMGPYAHAGLHVQIATPLSLTLRQTARLSSQTASTDRLYPGLDIKLRLMKESTYGPEIALGALSAIGHKRMAGEYLALSKQFGNWDLTAGMAWGRLGSAGHIKNPLGFLMSRFDKKRPLDGDNPSGPHDWFTGQDVGFLGGLSYATPIDGLTLKADWNADKYKTEQAAFGYHTPAPWSAGFSYSPRQWIHIGAALIGGQKIMGTLNLQSPLQNWTGRRTT